MGNVRELLFVDSTPKSADELQSGQRAQVFHPRGIEELVAGELFVVQSEVGGALVAIYERGPNGEKIDTGFRFRPLEGDQIDRAHFEVMPLTKSPRGSKEEPVAPAQGRSDVYVEDKIRNDYPLFFPDDRDPDSKSTADMQRALFEKFRPTNPIDAWEFLLARQWNEWDEAEKKRVFDNLSDSERFEWVRCL